MEEKIPSVLRSVRLKCLDCSCGSPKEVEICPVTNCALYPYRFGKSLTRKGRSLTDEQKSAARERLLAYHAKKRGDRGLPE